MATPAVAPAKRQMYRVRPRSVARGNFTNWVFIKKFIAPERLSEGEHGKAVVMIESQKRTQRGFVIAAAPEIPDLHPGDLVCYTNFPMELQDVEELTGQEGAELIADEEVYAVFEPVEADGSTS